jgi:uncharacterized oxidoreductase
VREEIPALNVLVNNAGIGRTERLTTNPVDLSISRAIIETNIMGVLQVTAALLPTLKQRSNSPAQRSSRLRPASPSCRVATFRLIAP